MNFQFYNKYIFWGLLFIGMLSACQNTEQQVKEESTVTVLCRDSTLYNGRTNCCLKQLAGTKFELKMTSKLEEKIIEYEGIIDLTTNFEFSIKELNEDGFLDAMFITDGKYQLLLSQGESFVLEEYEQIEADSTKSQE